jgi:hypothetical protein
MFMTKKSNSIEFKLKESIENFDAVICKIIDDEHSLTKPEKEMFIQEIEVSIMDLMSIVNDTLNVSTLNSIKDNIQPNKLTRDNKTTSIIPVNDPITDIDISRYYNNEHMWVKEIPDIKMVRQL